MAEYRPLVSVVCPAYHEQEVLPHFHEELSRVLAPLEARYRFEILFVDDGSRDDTLAVAKWLVFASDRAEALDRAARGLGKALWWGPFKIQFYGRTAAGAAA